MEKRRPGIHREAKPSRSAEVRLIGPWGDRLRRPHLWLCGWRNRGTQDKPAARRSGSAGFTACRLSGCHVSSEVVHNVHL
ncbi:unnamed protein product [Merluccius merluccius]